MAESTSIQLQKRGTFSLPKAVCDEHHLKEGDSFSLMDLGGGAFVLTPLHPRIPDLSDRLERIREEEGVAIEKMLEGLREQRWRSEEQRE